MSATILPFRRPAPKLDYIGNDWVVCLVERHGRKIAPEVVLQGSWSDCFGEYCDRAFRHHVTGTLYRIMPAREVRQQ